MSIELRSTLPIQARRRSRFVLRHECASAICELVAVARVQPQRSGCSRRDCLVRTRSCVAQRHDVARGRSELVVRATRSRASLRGAAICVAARRALVCEHQRRRFAPSSRSRQGVGSQQRWLLQSLAESQLLRHSDRYSGDGLLVAIVDEAAGRPCASACLQSLVACRLTSRSSGRVGRARSASRVANCGAPLSSRSVSLHEQHPRSPQHLLSCLQSLVVASSPLAAPCLRQRRECLALLPGVAHAARCIASSAALTSATRSLAPAFSTSGCGAARAAWC